MKPRPASLSSRANLARRAQWVPAEAEPEHRLVGRQPAHEGDEIVPVGRLEEHARGPADAPARVARHRHVLLQKAADAHAFAPYSETSRPGALPTSPAPTVSSTSPSRTTPRKASGSSLTALSTTGSTLPRARIPRASAGLS